MRITQRGVLPPVQFAELDIQVRQSLLSPAGARIVLFGDLESGLGSSTLLPANGAALVQAGDVRVLATLRHAMLEYDGNTQTITRQLNITNVTRSSAGVYTVDFTAAGFAVVPFVSITPSNDVRMSAWQSKTTTQIVVNLWNLAGSLTDGRVDLIALGN